MFEHESPHKVKLGDDYQYPIKESGEASYKPKYGKYLKMKDVLYVPRLKKIILSISSLDAKGIRVSFVDGQVLMWPRGENRRCNNYWRRIRRLVKAEGTS